MLVGLSGGMDSTALLHLLATSLDAPLAVRALHVHHGLHREADAWAAHCQRLCDALGVALTIARVEVRRDQGDGLEASARTARYAAFAAELQPDEVLALAHHREDQAETFLLRALRASGPDGLGAMRPWRTLGRGWLWRPLLDIPRATLEQHARRSSLDWIEDAANADTTHDRNFLRHRLLPLLRERWPDPDASLARSAALCAQASGLLDAEDQAALSSAQGDTPRMLKVPALLALPGSRRARVLRRWIDSLGLPPLPAQGVAHVEADLLGTAGDGQPEFSWAGASIRRWRDALHAGLEPSPWPPGWAAEWDGRAPCTLPDGGSLQLQGAAGFDAPVRVCARQGGERITQPGRTHSHALKHVLQALDIPPWRRARLPLLLDARGAVLAAGDVAISASLHDWLRARSATLRHALPDD